MRHPTHHHLRLSFAALALAAFVSLPLAGCGSTAKPATGGSGGGTETPASSVDVKATPEAGKEVSQLVTPEGATLTAKSASGTSFTLTIPAGALLKSQQITLAPATVEGLPFSGAQAGTAQLSPEGLGLIIPATLKISSPNVVAASGFETAAYGYRGTGTGLYLDVAEIKGQDLTLAVSHFSGYGAAQATPAEIKTQAAHVPAAPEDAFRQRLAELQMTNRQASLMGKEIDPGFASKTEAILRDWYKNVVEPALPTTKDCAKAPDVFSETTSWMRQVELRGMGEQFKAEEAQAWAAMAETNERCFGGYKAVGGYDQGTHSGDVPSLEKPFTITVTTGPSKTTLSFTPSSKEAGTLSISGSGPGGAKFSGGGTYTVENAESAAPVLNVDFKSKTVVAGVNINTSRKIPIQLVLKGQ